jgi:hypothetical protein
MLVFRVRFHTNTKEFPVKKQTTVLSFLLALGLLMSSGCGLLFYQADPEDYEFYDNEDEQPQVKKTPKIYGGPMALREERPRDPHSVSKPRPVERPPYVAQRKPAVDWSTLRKNKIATCKYDLNFTEGKIIGQQRHYHKPDAHGFTLSMNDRFAQALCLLDKKCLDEKGGDHNSCVQLNRCCDITIDKK